MNITASDGAAIATPTAVATLVTATTATASDSDDAEIGATAGAATAEPIATIGFDIGIDLIYRRVEGVDDVRAVGDVGHGLLEGQSG